MGRLADFRSAFAPILHLICAFSANKPDRLLSIIVKWAHFHVKPWFFARHFVIVSFVFIHMSGSIFIFNISKDQRPVSDLE